MSARNLLDGALGVISKGMAPRPVTPTLGTHSMPSSPSRSGSFDGAQGLRRVPSHDALERSIHNDSGHGQSPAQIIRDLKASNAALSARTAKMEVEFMNEINKVTMAHEKQQQKLQEALQKKDDQMATMEARCQSTESRIRERDSQLTKIKEETAFQRHTISDLKNQLHQVKSQMEETEFHKRDKDKKTVNDGASDPAQDGRTLEELKEELLERDETINGLRDKVTDYTDEISVLKKDLEKTKAEAKNRETYHRDETADLRVLYDAHVDEIERLKVEVDECHRELDEKDDALNEKENELAQKAREYKELEASRASSSASDSDLQQKLDSAREMLQKLEREMKAQQTQHNAVVAGLRKEIKGLEAERDDFDSRLAVVVEERNKAVQKIENIERKGKSEEDSRSARRMRQIVASAAKDKAELERHYDTKFTELENRKRAEVEEIRGILMDQTTELEAMKNKLTKKSQALDTKDKGAEMSKLKERIHQLETKVTSHARVKKQLREAQLALVALDDDRQKMCDAHRKEKLELELAKDEIESSYRSRLAELEATSDEPFLKSEVDRLTGELEEMKHAALDAAIEKSTQEHTDRGAGAMHEELVAAKEAEKRLSVQIDSLKQKNEQQRQELEDKLKDRDTTIATMVKSSLAEEARAKSMKSEMEALRERAENASKETASAVQLARDARDAELLEEIEKLREEAKVSTANEKRLSSDLKVVRKNLFAAEVESRRLRDETSRLRDERARLRDEIDDGAWSSANGGANNSSVELEVTLTDQQDKLEERDAAIAKLVKQAMSQDALVARLQSQISSLEAKLANSMSNSRKEASGEKKASQLQKENEIFASQIIEQDEELEALRSDIESRDAQVASLSQELGTLRSQLNVRGRGLADVEDLRAELDEAKEANDTHRQELRDLRRQLREARTEAARLDDLKLELAETHQELEEYRSKLGSSAREDATLRRDLEDAIADRDDIETKMTQELEVVRRQRQSEIEALEAKVRDLEEEIESMKNASADNSKEAVSLQAQVDTLKKDLEKQAGLVSEAESLTKEVQMLTEERELLTKELSDVKTILKSLEEDKENIAVLKERLARAEEGRMTAEQGIIDSYERKLSLIKLDKDVTIDGLRKELAEEKGINSDDYEDLMKEIHHLETENKDLRDELEAKVQQKDTKIYALEQTLGAQEQLVDNMRAEMDQLQSSMERNSYGRRAEIEEMQQEVYEKSAKAAKQEREIATLKMELEDIKLSKVAEVTKLKEKIVSLENTEKPPLVRSMAEEQTCDTDQRLDELKERLEQVKWRNTQLQEDNKKLRVRLEKAETVSNASSTEDKSRISELQQEVISLQQQVKELEEAEEESSLAPPPPPPSLLGKRPPKSDQSSSFRRSKQPVSSSEPRGRAAHSASPRRTPASPGRLPFLKRRSRSKDFKPEEIPKA